MYLLDEYSDSSEFGGESETEIEQVKDTNGNFLRLKSFLRKESNNLLPIDYVFSGFKTQFLH